MRVSIQYYGTLSSYRLLGKETRPRGVKNDMLRCNFVLFVLLINSMAPFRGRFISKPFSVNVRKNVKPPNAIYFIVHGTKHTNAPSRELVFSRERLTSVSGRILNEKSFPYEVVQRFNSFFFFHPIACVGN
ncbi:hypothetical protein, unlikely [Trypanosoma brucei gambiense DAL972]|uniref:Uncharacterized protein n=1 Tax=Trypanosoma brucei gambiense (strain MHOM/CI/86/DAL972) TaxID=679716 RepID=C9ZKT5_TRYB9|nr:hypothetical protein, unlikely [Trypanosoma brucei gambiense DAL972]CBH09678.1 hypothetical protein, unlikely [Trypanosoma brucei gambiense DAL972]|eukprot:XP_011771971.1 hypothetical protein, unlikely [Trypanosoma brucei gambiense DAL972]